MSENGDLIKRIDVLETHIAHQDSIIDELNDDDDDSPPASP